MAGRALKQTGSRSIEAALDYISKMGYLDPRNEQIVRVIKQTSPGERRPALGARTLAIFTCTREAQQGCPHIRSRHPAMYRNCRG